MTTALTSNEREFVYRMTKGSEYATTGFQLLSERRSDILDKYFDLLQEKGLFATNNNQKPIPSWPALEYLAAVAKIADKRNDECLAGKIMDIVRTGSEEGNSVIRSSDNHHACLMFARIIGLVPLSTVNMDDIELIPSWLNNEFDSGYTAKEISEGILSRTLDENEDRPLKMACRILYHCTAIKSDGEADPGYGRFKPATVVDNFWLEQLLNKHIPTFVEKTVEEAAEIFIKRLKQMVPPERNWSGVVRPAIEGHSQNHPWENPVNRFVEGLRDVLSRWVVHDAQAARTYINKLKDDKTGIIQRIVIHTLNYHWADLKDFYIPIVSSELFQDENLHELYELLSTRFTEMTQQQRNATLNAIRSLPEPDYYEVHYRELFLKRKQRNWLSAIAGKGNDSADEWYAELNADENIGALSPHPSFSSYTASWWVPGPPPYTVQELLIWAKNDTLVEMLNNFEETDSRRGPTIHALADTLVEAIKEDPQLFISILAKFVRARRPYQYGIVNGFNQLWEVEKDSRTKVIDWVDAWEKLFDFFDQLLSNEDFWRETVTPGPDLAPDRNRVAAAIARFLHAGTHDDSHSYPSALLPRAWKLITLLLEKIEPEAGAEGNAMYQAINSTRGKVIEALFSHTLRACRVSDKVADEHHAVWTVVRPTFEKELWKCKGANFEFSTLAGACLTNLAYIDHEWLRENIQRIFPEEYMDNCICALEGMVHATASRPIYTMMMETGILDRALQMDIKNQHAKDILLQRVALAYLWGDEAIENPRFKRLFELRCCDDLQVVSDYLGSIGGQDFKPEHIERIVEFWSHAVDWCQSSDESPTKLLSSLSNLACYLEAIDEDALRHLLIVARHLGGDGYEFIKELERLFKNHPEEVLRIVDVLSETYYPGYDYQDRLKSLIEKIAKHSPQGKIKAIQYVDKLASKNLPGMRELYDELSSN